MSPTGPELIRNWIEADPVRWSLLGCVRDLGLPDCWIAAGFVRDMVWSKLHGQPAVLNGDVDVIWYDPDDASEQRDRAIEAKLRSVQPEFDWSVKNQARMHLRNGDAPYVSSEDAMRFWPETATAIGVRRNDHDRCEVIAPLGVDDLFALKIVPAGAFADRKREIFDARVRVKRWLERYPRLTLAEPTPPSPAGPSPARPRLP